MTGYLPTTRSAATTSQMTDYWKEQPEYKVAYNQLSEIGHDFPFSTHLAEVKTAIQNAVGTLIQDQSCTPEEALESIQKEASLIDWE